MANNEIYDSMIQSKGSAYRDNQIKSYSHYREQIDTTSSRLAGNSHVWGDASPEVQSRVIDTLISASEKAGLNTRQTAQVLAIARVESGFNPDAAAGTTSAHGLGQFIDRTGEHYGINDNNRNDVSKQADALVAHYLDNSKLASTRGQGEEYIYKYHHDGPTKDYGGLAISNSNVMPYIDKYEAFVRAHSQGQTLSLDEPNQHASKKPGALGAQASRSLSSTDNVLSAGEKGSEIRDVQQLLNTFGYRDTHNHPLKTDGDFGQKTKEAVQAFQQAHGLDADGIVGAKTLEVLKKAEQSPLLSNHNHPDHSLYQQALSGIENLPSSSFHSNQERQNAAATVVFEAKVSGMNQIDHVVLSKNGDGLFAVQGALNDPAHHRIHVDKNQAATQPVEKSSVQLQQETQQAQPQLQQQNETRRMLV